MFSSGSVKTAGVVVEEDEDEDEDLTRSGVPFTPVLPATAAVQKVSSNAGCTAGKISFPSWLAIFILHTYRCYMEMAMLNTLYTMNIGGYCFLRSCYS